MAEQFELNFDNLMTVLTEYAEEVRYMYRNRLILDDKFATRNLIQNIKTDVKVKGQKFEVVLYLMDYWKYVEEGRGPGKFPPTDKILEWIEAKPVLPEPDKNGRKPTPEQLAYLIGRKISKEGIEGGHQLKETVQQVNSRWVPILQNALNEDIGAYMIKTFNGVKKMIRI